MTISITIARRDDDDHDDEEECGLCDRGPTASARTWSPDAWVTISITIARRDDDDHDDEEEDGLVTEAPPHRQGLGHRARG